MKKTSSKKKSATKMDLIKNVSDSYLFILFYTVEFGVLDTM